MWTKQFFLVVGALCMYQVVAQEIYVAEIMVESNVTLTSKSILESWSSSVDLIVNGVNVKINSSELVAECLVVGEEYSCNCSTGYAWSNEVCYNYGCCTEATCLKNVSQATSICVPKTNVVINGLVEKSPIANLDGVLLTHFQKLNGLNGNPTSLSVSSSAAYSFEVNVSVPLNTSKLQEILDGLTAALTSPPIFVNTKGMVKIVAPIGEVNYTSSQSLECTFDEPSDHTGWNLTRGLERFELNNGLLTEIINKCPSVDCVSYVKVNLKSVTGVWAGVYECGFSIGRVRHTASAELKVALLPDVITMTFKPLIADCTDKTAHPKVTVTATIPKHTRIYDITWDNNGKTQSAIKTEIKRETYEFNATINCALTSNPVGVKFKNNNSQETSKTVTIPILLATQSACQTEALDSFDWPKTPSNTTVENPECPGGRVGYRSRYCNTSAQWEGVVSKCVSAELGKVANAAENFLNGLGATQEVAKNIFEGLKNSSSSSSEDSVDTLADIDASIGVFGVMAKATKNVDLEEDVLPDVVDAASNMVNSSWNGVDPKVIHQMSSNYLKNVETLVKNIKINTSEGFNSTNLELRFCSSDDCSISVFGIDVNLNKTNGTMKTMGVKNLMEKMKNDKFPGRNHSSILLSATLVGNNDSDIKIKMFFPDEQPTATERLCVFWDTNKTDWSSEGCIANVTDDNQTLCECNHLTSFSVLMSKSANVSSPELDIITYIGLGVSIFSLLIFLFVESLVWSAVTKTNLSHFRHTAVVNIAVFRLLADCSFLASAEPKKLSDTWCFTFTVCKHLFYLTMFCWMLCLSVMLVHQLIFVFSPVRKRVFMYLSSIVGYVVPIALVGTSYVYYKYKEQDYYDRDKCWLTYVRLLEGSIHAFLLPVGTIILSNLFSMVVVIVTLVKTSVPDSSKSDDKDTAKSILKVIVFLAPVFGVTWIIGFALLMLDGNDPLFQVANYAFVILNSFQGLFILLTGCVGEQKVRQEVIRIIMAKTGQDTDSTKKLTNSSTTLYTKDK